jgi:hypothetical protein
MKWFKKIYKFFYTKYILFQIKIESKKMRKNNNYPLY